MQLAELKNADIEQMEKMIPFITCEIALCQYVCELVLGVKRAKRLSQALVHLVTLRANLFTDQRMSGPPMHAKYKHFSTL